MDTVFISWEKLDRDFYYIMDYLKYPATFKNVWPGYINMQKMKVIKAHLEMETTCLKLAKSRWFCRLIIIIVGSTSAINSIVDFVSFLSVI